MICPINILLVEDDRNDALLLKLAFGQAGPDDRLLFVSDGRQAIDYLAGKPPFDNRALHPFPDLLVLDLKMPGLTGFDVLQWARQHPNLKPTVVAVLSGSNWRAEIDQAYALGADFYVTKPLDFERLVGVAERLKQKCSSLPPPPPVFSSPQSRARPGL